MLARLYLTTGDTATLTAEVNLSDGTDPFAKFRDDISYSGATQFELVEVGDVHLDFNSLDLLIDQATAGIIANITTANTFRIDFIHLMPYPYVKLTKLDSSRQPLPSQPIVLIEDRAYHYNISGQRVLDAVAVTGQLLFTPRKLNYLFVLFGNAGYEFIADQQSQVRLWFTNRYKLPGGPIA